MNENICFAFINNQCTCLEETNCEKCTFFRSDIDSKDIEQAIKNYERFPRKVVEV